MGRIGIDYQIAGVDSLELYRPSGGLRVLQGDASVGPGIGIGWLEIVSDRQSEGVSKSLILVYGNDSCYELWLLD